MPPRPAQRVAAALRSFSGALTYALSVYAVPAAIGVVSLLALLEWEERYEAGRPATVPVAVAEDRPEALTPAGAAQALRAVQRTDAHETRLSEAPFWFLFQPRAGGERIEFPSRHALELACWDAASGIPLGRADRAAAEGALAPLKAGFVLAPTAAGLPPEIVCRGRFAGPARISVRAWRPADLAVSVDEFHRNAGLLEGGLLVLAAFVLVTAAINREWLYVLLAAWLVASMRLGALSAGWDTQWLGRDIPPGWVLTARKLTIAAYFTLTYVLFARLFREDLRRVGVRPLLAAGEWSCIVVIAAAFFLSFARFLPVMWLCTAVAISIIVFHLLRLLARTPSVVAVWYSGSLAIVLLGGLSEVVAAAFGVKNLLGMLNSVSAALASSLMVALAIAEQMRQERLERVHAQAALRTTYEAIPIGLFTLGADGAFERVNPALAGMLGIDPVTSARRYWQDYFEAGSWERLQLAVRRGGSADLEVRGRADPAGEERRYHVKAARTGDRVEGSLQDVTERARATEQLRYLAENDPLTGVLNRRGVEKIIEEATRHAADGGRLAVAYLDLDRFKLINDLFGHVAGDDVLRQVCRRIDGLLSRGQTLGRIGGDEFVIVFRGSPIAAAAAICRGIIGAIGEESFLTGDKAFQVKASIGLVEVTGPLPVKDAIAVADRACRAAKSTSGGLVVYAGDADVFRERARELRLIERLGARPGPEGLFLMMQPILSLASPFDSLNFEALVRMRDPAGGIVPAGVLIRAAENNGQAALLDRWVLQTTLAWLEANHARLAATRFATMNLSGASLNDERFMEDACAMLAAAPRAAERLCIEVTEGVALHDLDNTRRFIDRVRGYGAKVALDDFGAGYTSFSYLKELPADALKIDGSFIVNVNAHPSNLAIVEAIVELARNLGMRSIAEWAEDRATVESLARAGVDYVQGFAVSGALMPEAILGATSAAALIRDADMQRYVREELAPAAGRIGYLRAR